MYCVKCGVKLQEGVSACPLCGTPVWNPDAKTEEERSYPDSLPSYYRDSGLPGAVALTFVCVAAIAALFIVCFKLYGQLCWGGYAVGGVLLFYVVAVLPEWFRHPRAEIFVPVDFAAAALYTLYVSVHTGGHWFLPFAFPVIGVGCVLTVGMICLLKYVRRGRIFIIGGFLVLLGGFTVLVELFQHIAFGAEMFRWSLYSLAGFGSVGLFLLIAGMIPSLRRGMEKRFFF